MSMSDGDNLYLTLELFLDPPQDDFEKLKDEIRKKIPDWNKLKTGADPKYAHMVQVADDFIKRPAPPRPPEKELFIQAKEARDSRLKDLTMAVKGDEIDGILEKREFEATLKRFIPYFSETTVRSQYTLTVYEFPVPREPVHPEGVTETPRSRMDKLAADLKITGKKDLYDLLGVARTSDLKALRTRRDVNYKTASKKPKTGPLAVKTSAEIRALGEADLIFKDDRSRFGYDLALKRRPFDRLVKSVFEKIASKKSVSHDEYLFSIEQARQVGLSQVEAEWYVYDYYCRQRKLEPPKKPVVVPKRIQCPECFYLNDNDAKVCKCGIPLRIRCPRCGREGAFGDLACTQCAFPIGNMPNAVMAVKAAREAIFHNEIEEAEQLVFQINAIWRDCPGAEEVRNAVKELKSRFTERRKQMSDLESGIRDALGKHFLYEAKRLFLDLRNIPETKSILADEERHTVRTLDQVRAKLDLLPGVVETAEKIELCEDILSLAADCREARDALEKYPPLPPTDLSARLNGAGAAELLWQGPPSRKTPLFVVVRKTGAAPASPGDGEVLADNLANPVFVDSSCEIGVIYGYAVFTRRDRIIENAGCRSALVQRIDNLDEIEVLPGNGNLAFGWSTPANCLGVRITRFEDDSLEGPGTPLPIRQDTGFVDSGLKNGETYTYRFQTQFRGCDGETVETTGTILSAKPQIPPPAVTDLESRDASGVMTMLRWTPPAQGELLLYDLSSRPDIPVGQAEYTNPLELKNRYGEPIPILSPEQGRTRWENPATGIRHVLPVTFLDGLVVYGRSVAVMRLADIEQLQAKISGPKLFLSWIWPKGLEKVLVTYRHDRYPDGRTDPVAVSRVLSKEEYDLEKAFVLSAENTQDFFFRVHALVDSGAEPSYSRGMETQTTRTAITWRLAVRRRRLFWGQIRKFEIMMKVEEGRPGFPDMIVKKDIGRPPLNRNYGSLVTEIPAQSKNTLTVPIGPDRLNGDEGIRLFVKDEGLAENYAFYGPSVESVRLQMKLETFGDFFREFFRHPVRFIKRFRG